MSHARMGWMAMAAMLAAPAAFAALEGPGVDQRIEAVRASSTLRIDGSFDEPAWATAPVFDAFVQSFPTEGGAPSERTEVRVLYDDHHVYVAVLCHDSQPAQINRSLGRRDAELVSDTVQVVIDSLHDHNSAYTFAVNAGGVLFDGLWYGDASYTAEWDAVWEAAAIAHPDGWAAELAIPFSVLRFPAAEGQLWGFGVLRHVARTHEDLGSVPIPRSGSGRVSRLGHLAGLQGVRPRQAVELTPYVATRTVLRPQFSDPARPSPRLFSPSLDVGLDAKAALSSDLTLNATLNPDFSQVEADQLLLNLTNFEPFFPEKRPFFTQGMDLFQPVGAEDGFAPQMLFYSRRVGLDAPILGAAKLTGTVGRGIEIGLLDAVVMGPGSGQVDEANPDPRLEFHWNRPLHLGPLYELPARESPPQNTAIGVVRGRPSENATVGAQVALGTPLTGECTEADAAEEPWLQPLSCSARGGNAAALSGSLRSADADWAVLGQLAGSQVVGGPPERLLADGTRLRRGALGLGSYVQGGKVGGEPFRFDVRYRYASPTLELNPTGYLATQNIHSLIVNAGYTRPNGFGPLHAFDLKLNAGGTFSADGRWVARERAINLMASAILPGFHFVEADAGYYSLGSDIWEIGSTGIPFERVGTFYGTLLGQTDTSRPLSASALGMLTWNERASAGRGALGYAGDLGVAVRPDARVETKLTVHVEDVPSGPRWVDTPLAGEHVFGDLRARTLSVILRQQVVLTPELIVQVYGQLFVDHGAFGPFYSARSDGAGIRLAELAPASFAGDPSFHDATMNLNVVLRWEYRPGSAAYLVYVRSQREAPTPAGAPVPRTLLPVDLFGGPATDSLMIKVSGWWGT